MRAPSVRACPRSSQLRARLRAAPAPDRARPRCSRAPVSRRTTRRRAPRFRAPRPDRATRSARRAAARRARVATRGSARRSALRRPRARSRACRENRSPRLAADASRATAARSKCSVAIDLQPERIAQVVLDRAVEHRRALRDIRDAPPVSRNARARDRLAAPQDRPASTGSSSASARRNTLLPEPDGPVMTARSPSCSVKSVGEEERRVAHRVAALDGAGGHERSMHNPRRRGRCERIGHRDHEK